jgi:hypothetical protein
MKGLFCFTGPGTIVVISNSIFYTAAARYLEVDSRMPRPRKLTFLDPDKIGELAQLAGHWVLWRVGKCISRLSKRAGGGIYLRLTPEYAKPRRPDGRT